MLVSALALLTGCATSLQMPGGDVALKTNEGRVIGSVLITVQSTNAASSLGWLKGWKAESYSYRFDIGPAYSFPNRSFKTARIYTIDARVGQEEVFVSRLPAGTYKINRLTPQGGSYVYGDIGRPFNVTAGQTTYIGRLVIEFPERIGDLSPFVMRVEDRQRETLQAARAKTGIVLTNIVKELIK